MDNNFKFYTGNLMICNRYLTAQADVNLENSSIYLENAFLYKLKNGKFFHIEDGPDSELTNFISLMPEKVLEDSNSAFGTEARCLFDIYVDERSLKPYLIIDKNNNPVK